MARRRSRRKHRVRRRTAAQGRKAERVVRKHATRVRRKIGKGLVRLGRRMTG